jgi:hypothetical protein
MNFLPVEFIPSREFHPELAEKVLQYPFFWRLYNGDMLFTDEFLNFFDILFVFNFDDHFHGHSPAFGVRVVRGYETILSHAGMRSQFRKAFIRVQGILETLLLFDTLKISERKWKNFSLVSAQDSRRLKPVATRTVVVMRRSYYISGKGAR